MRRGVRLTVLNVAYPFAGVGKDQTGGAEQIVSALDEAVVAAGWESFVVAAKGSKARGTLVESCELGEMLTPEARSRNQALHRARILEVIESRPVDLIHLHGVDFHEYLPPEGVPVLVTLHLPPDWYPTSIYNVTRARTYFHCVSRTQHSRCPPCSALLEPIENGVEMPGRTHVHRRDFAMSLGRICPEKGFHHAMDVARMAGVPFILGGEVFPYEAHIDYFQREIRPREDDRRRWVGPLRGRRKERFLSGARCLLVTSTVEETSSLVAMEALAAGTPVVAFRRGALPAVVEDGRTGFLVDSVQEMASAIKECGKLDGEACRAAARERFSRQRMARQYLERYALLAGSE